MGLLPPHASVGSWGQNPRSNLFDHLLRVRESDRYKCDIASQDGEKVAGQDGSGVGAHELGPGRAIAPRSRRQMTPGGRDRIADLEHLALNASITPARVLPGQAQYQVPQVA